MSIAYILYDCPKCKRLTEVKETDPTVCSFCGRELEWYDIVDVIVVEPEAWYE